LDKVAKLWIDEYLLNHNNLPNSKLVLDKIIEFNQFEYA